MPLILCSQSRKILLMPRCPGLCHALTFSVATILTRFEAGKIQQRASRGPHLAEIPSEMISDGVAVSVELTQDEQKVTFRWVIFMS